MVCEPTTWRELFRTDDRNDALTVVTTIAAMEFDIRWRSQPKPARVPVDRVRLAAVAWPRAEVESVVVHNNAADDAGDDDDAFGDPPYIIEVRDLDWENLVDVLEAIRDEQWEFEDRYQQGRIARDRVLIGVTAALALAPVAIEILSAFRGNR